jgi:hypothetical protein
MASYDRGHVRAGVAHKPTPNRKTCQEHDENNYRYAEGRAHEDTSVH